MRALPINAGLARKQLRDTGLSERLLEISGGRVTLVYGNAGSGKTNLCLWVLSKTPGPALYLSTEGTIPAPLLDRYSLVDREFYFREAFSLEDLSVQLVGMLAEGSLGDFKSICVDSVNAHYRYEVAGRQDANKLLNALLAALSYAASRFGSRVVLTAQVREEEGEHVPSGYDVLSFWSDVILRARRSGDLRELEAVKPEELRGLRFAFRISERGVEFG